MRLIPWFLAIACSATGVGPRTVDTSVPDAQLVDSARGELGRCASATDGPLRHDVNLQANSAANLRKLDRDGIEIWRTESSYHQGTGLAVGPDDSIRLACANHVGAVDSNGVDGWYEYAGVVRGGGLSLGADGTLYATLGATVLLHD